jgi:glutamine synthetase
MIDRKDKKRPELVEEVLKTVKKNEVMGAWLQFVDIDGIVKSVEVNSNRLDDVMESGASFDGSSIDGFGVLQESDMVAIPDPSTFALVPWRTSETAVARFLCDVYLPNETRYEGDPRYILQRAVKKATDLGYTMMAAPELEFFILQENGQNLPGATDMRGYFDSDPTDESHLLKRDIAAYAEKFPGLIIETVHHEVARSQHEIDIKYSDPMTVSDACVTLKQVIKVVAAKRGFIATFMPKPWSGHNGSGMHVHTSLWDAKGKINLFYDAKSPNGISKMMRHWIGGQLKYAKEMTALLDSWPNSYKRLVPGYEAPTYIAWGFKNRSMLIRVPNFFGKSKAARCEIRSPDPAGNIYLQMAALLTTGLEGVKHKIEPPDPVELNVFKIKEEERKKMGVDNLPESLGQAIHVFKESKIMLDMMGPEAFKAFINSKTGENTAYNMQVTDWELQRYSKVL